MLLFYRGGEFAWRNPHGRRREKKRNKFGKNRDFFQQKSNRKEPRKKKKLDI